MIKRNKKYALKRMVSDSDDLTPALFRTILYVLPVFGPLLAPFESPATPQANLGFKTIFGLWGWAHGSSLVLLKRQVLNDPS
jgi:hypothetical protein